MTLRRVVTRESNGDPGWRGGGSWIDTLECGHTVRVKRSAGKPKRRQCPECPRATPESMLLSRIRAAASDHRNRSPQLRVLARFIQEQWPDLRVELRDWTTNTDRKVGRLRVPGKGRKGKLLEVFVRETELLSGWRRLFRYESGETYRTNNDVCAWITQRMEAQG